ncbi:MAG: hypothetical protein RR226_06095 [Oscillospiraceae bacterium]
MGFFSKLFGSDASFLGFMDFMDESVKEPQEEVEFTFTIEFEDDKDKQPPKRKPKTNAK